MGGGWERNRERENSNICKINNVLIKISVYVLYKYINICILFLNLFKILLQNIFIERKNVMKTWI